MNESGYPRNIAYSVKSLQSFSKSTVRLTPDKAENVTAGETIRVKLPPNSLIDMRTFSMYFEGTATNSSGGGQVHFPRLSSSVIDQLSIYVNGTMVESINSYNTLYNCLFDLDCGGIDQLSKRSVLENIDPSVDYTVNVATGATTRVLKTLDATASDSNKKMMINNWIGMISSLSTPVIDTNDCSDIFIEFRLAPATILWAGGDNVTNVVSAPNYSLSKIRFTISKIVFNNPDYYNMKASKLLGQGLTIGYQTYITNRGSVVPKATSLSYTVNINSTSLDQVIGTFLDKDYNIVKPLQLGGAGVDATAQSFYAALVAPVNDANTVATTGDLFNNSVYFKRNALGITGSSYEINNVMMNPAPLKLEEVYNETLIALGGNHADMSSGIAPGCVSDAHFAKYYFAHILSLENISNDGQFWKSGLDGRAASMSINFKTEFTGTTDNCTPVIFCKCTRLLQINEAHQISVIV